MRKQALLALAAILVVGCATATPGTRRLDANRISREEILEQGPCTAWVLVRNLRPIWLRKRGQQSFEQESDVIVYVDGVRFGERESLRQIDSQNVDFLEFLDARRATVRFGSGHVNGAILIHLLG